MRSDSEANLRSLEACRKATQELKMQEQTPRPEPSRMAHLLAAAAVVALGVLVWWAVEIRTAPPPAGYEAPLQQAGSR